MNRRKTIDRTIIPCTNLCDERQICDDEVQIVYHFNYFHSILESALV